MLIEVFLVAVGGDGSVWQGSADSVCRVLRAGWGGGGLERVPSGFSVMNFFFFFTLFSMS